jgi:thiamine-phosphate pyrophosphorylase
VTKLKLQRSAPLTYAITDRRLLLSQKAATSQTHLIEFIEENVNAGVDMVQIRERDLTGRDLYDLAQTIAKRMAGKGAFITINDRADIAACAGTGVHLTTRSLTAEVVRREFGPEMLVGVSTHNETEAEAAASGGADFIVFGPVFETASKSQYGDPVGIEALREVSASMDIPVIALGGVNLSNFREVLNAGAAGVAGISMFADAYVDESLPSLISTIKNFQQG